MSWTVSLYVGESFAEISAKEDRQANSLFWRWYIPQTPLEKGIQRFLQENKIVSSIKEVRISTRLARQIINRRLGQVPALLVTEGFENWPLMNLPVQNEHFSMHPRRSQPPIASHLVFGLTGRMNSQGEEEKPLDMEELEFLVSKLKLNKVNHVVLGLLHSVMNPSHEIQAEAYLKEQGFQVYPSYGLAPALVEKPRWWHTILNAYLEPAFKLLKEQILLGFGDTLIEENCLKLTLGNALPDGENWQKPLGSFFGSAFLLNHVRENPSDAILYLGLEEFLLLPSLGEDHLDWFSSFGRVHLPHPETKELSIQPSTIISKSVFGCPHFSREAAGFEPGPMCFGRGVNPLFLDLLFVNQRLENIEILRHHINPKMDQRVRETLYAYSREAIQGSNYGESEILSWMEETAINLLASEIRSNSRDARIRTAGPMASVILPLLKSNLKEFEFLSLAEFNPPLSEHLLHISSNAEADIDNHSKVRKQST